ANHTAQNEAPEDPVEAALAAIWQDVLGVEQVGRHANFFELGGDSIIAMQVSARIRETLDGAFALRALFTNPTLAALAPHIGHASREPSADTQQIGKLPRTGTLPLSPAQRRLWIAARLATHDAASYNVTATVKLDGALSAAHVQTALAMLTARHETLRASYPDRDGQPYASIAAYQVPDFVSRDLSGLDDDAQRAALDELARTRIDSPFDVTRGPLMRATLVRLAPQRHRLMLSLHHLICDGWSMGVLVSEFSGFYRAAQSGTHDALLAPLDVQYVDYAAWHRQQLDGARTDGLRAFWRERLDGAPHALDLPVDFPRPPTVSQAGDSLLCTLDAALARKVQDAAQRYRVTPFVVLLASYQLLLHRLTGSRDVLVGTDVAGRERVELEALIGFFVNVVPLRSRIDASHAGDAPLDIGRWLADTGASTISALEHSQLPLDQIVDTVKAVRDRRRNPLIQALFVLQNTPATTLDLPGVVSETLERPSVYSKFDMALFIEPHDSTWRAEWVFSTALFKPSTIQRWSVEWLSLLENIVTQTQIHATNPPRSADADGPAQASHIAHTTQSAQSAQQDKLAKLKKIASRGPRAPVAANAVTNVESVADTTRPPARVSALQAEQALPAVCEPWTSDVDPHAWARQHRAFIDATLAHHGTILFRGFNLSSVADFEAFAEAMSPGLYGGYGDLPKKEGGRNTYRSTPYPEREMILFHNESSHLERWPRKQWFYCELPSKVGGATPIVDCREMLRRLPAPIVKAFREKHLMYIRTFTDRLDVAWQDFFGTEVRADVETRLRAAGVAFRWLPNDGLQTRTICPGVITHPVTGELAFFNQVQLHHPYFLRADIRADLLKMVGPDQLPRNVCYGDGTPIDEADLAVIGEAYEACAVRFEWRAGDVVMLDNMLVAHARDPYEEPRKIVVAMGAMVERDALAAASVSAVNADETYP
ncbi:condensation domain-containing protein, partial [Paraburkholderia fungorum]|uniref:condensation domain-containing protein n=1 Tax=Paraburkholderia fungorum TaxID=134537 RepID=UPI0038BAB1CB